MKTQKKPRSRCPSFHVVSGGNIGMPEGTTAHPAVGKRMSSATILALSNGARWCSMTDISTLKMTLFHSWSKTRLPNSLEIIGGKCSMWKTVSTNAVPSQL